MGVILPDDNDAVWTSSNPGFPNSYWNAAAASYAYLFGITSVVGLDVLVGTTPERNRPRSLSGFALFTSEGTTINSITEALRALFRRIDTFEILPAVSALQGESQLVGYPSTNITRPAPYNGIWTAPPQYPSVAMLNWTDGSGTAVRVLSSFSRFVGSSF